MIVEIDMPDLTPRSASWPPVVLISAFGDGLAEDERVSALLNTFLRLSDSAGQAYSMASVELRRVWSGDNLEVSAVQRCVSHLENCVFNALRAIRCSRALNGRNGRRNAPEWLTDLLKSEKPQFISESNTRALAQIRNATYHAYREIAKGELPAGKSIALWPTGDEVPHPSETGQTVKKINRIEIGDHRMSFAELAEILNELSKFAARIIEVRVALPR